MQRVPLESGRGVHSASAAVPVVSAASATWGCVTLRHTLETSQHSAEESTERPLEVELVERKSDQATSQTQT